MQNKKTIGWLIGVPVLVILLIAFIMILSEKKPTGISRALAYKAVVLSMTSKDECEEQNTELTSHFAPGDQQQWYVKYIDYLYHQEYLDPELKIADRQAAEDWLTYGEVSYLASKISNQLKPLDRVTKKNKDQPIPKEDWWMFYQELLTYTDPDQQVEKSNLLIYGTPLNLEQLAPWTAYTDLGEIGFEGLGLDTYIDNELEVLLRDGEIINIETLIGSQVTYKNIWIADASEESFKAYIGTIEREFKTDQSLEEFLHQIVDLELNEGKIQKIRIKKDRITGKVLSVNESAIEIEGYGSIPLDANFQIYKVYGEFKRQKLSDILVGYEMQEFVVEDKKLCAALTVRDFQADTIRVMLMNDDYSSVYHNQIIVNSSVPVTLSYGSTGEQEEVAEAGSQMVISADDERLTEGRLILKPQDELAGITVQSIKRANEVRSYPGTLEIKKTDQGLILINELYMEEYLKRVVPSEMPADYEKEALKAQAVCARTYAYRQIQGNAYSNYGAHVDDSTNYQVYNRIGTNPKSNAAVDETYGELLKYGEAIAEAFYFSTSCGHTTDGTIWGSSLDDYPYLKGVRTIDGGGQKNLTSNAAFAEFIKDKTVSSFESSFPLYRWSTTLTSTQLEQKISDIGTIVSVSVKERGTGGIAKVLEIEGTNGTRTINGQGQIRSTLGSTDSKIKQNNGEVRNGSESLFSAFITVERSDPDENQVTTFYIYGGGYGHGVGMSQNGAQGMAKAGKSYEDILTFFYSGTTVFDINQ